MSVPKRRKSHGTVRKRRSHHGLAKITVVACPKCGAKIRPHHLCKSCGTYAGKQIIDMGKKQAKQTKRDKKRKEQRTQEGK